MLKKGLLTLVCLTVMSAVCAWAATTYSVRTQLTNSGGSIKVGNKAAQTAGIAYTNCSTAVAVVVTPNAGFKISALKQTDGATVTDITPVDGTVAATVNIAKPIPVDPKRPAVLKAQGVTATFASTNAVLGTPKTWQLQLTNTNRGGTITTNGTKGIALSSVGLPKLVNYTDTTPVTATITTTSGYKIRSIMTTGSVVFSNNSTGAVVTGIPAANKAVNPVVVTYRLKAYTVATNAGIAPANPAVAHGGAVRLIITPTLANNTITGIDVTGGTVAYTDRFGTPVTSLPFQGPLKATITNITSDISVTAIYGQNTDLAMERNCTNTCHLGATIRPAVKAVPVAWKASTHYASSVDCVDCHKTMPGTDVNCITCHQDDNATTALHTGATICSTCHTYSNGHSNAPVLGVLAGSSHLGGAVAPGHAQYVSANVTCVNCHAGNNAAIMDEFKASAHGNPAGEAWAHYDWRGASRAACQRCHNGTVFAAKLETLSDVTNFFGATPPVAAGEVLNCSACHSDVSTGALRAASTSFTVPMSNGATVAYDVPGASALCVRCHGGRESGDSVKLATAAFTNLSFINSHYLAAGGMVYNKVGYEFAGQSYDDLGYHKNVGKDNAFGTGTAGPCVACHMSEGAGHTWDFVTKDANGVITANNSTACASCHATDMTAAALEEAKEAVHAGLAELQAALAAKGILFFNAHPYFYKDLNANGVYDAATEAGSGNAFKNWDAVYPGFGKDVMGAAFNFNLVEHDPGAYAHNRAYSLKLIADSIDFLNDGVLDGDASAAKTALATGIWKPNAGTSTNHSSISNTANCAGCHSAGINPTTAAIEAAAGPANGGCGACHQGRANSFVTSAHFTAPANTTSACSFCHSSVEHGNTTITCTPCHSAEMETAFHDNYANPPAVNKCQDCHAGGGHPHSIKNTTVANLKTKCTQCHEMGQNHIGALDNDGVRAIVGEFTKRSHHVTGRDVNDADCAVCHMEGKNDGTKVVIDPAFHMVNDKIYLRNGNVALGQDDDKSVGGAYAWQPSNPDHTLMDQFCFSCHNAAGAPDAAAAMAGVTGYTGTALNPFGDTISNSYDQVSRLAVVDAYSQFDTGNSSHHAVRGQKYTTRTLTPEIFTNISTANRAAREGGVAKPQSGVKSVTGTMFELGKFTATYTTLNGDVLADDNVLHCGDCHTVGQFRAADVDLAVGSFNKAVIGAHGSENEYMLRNSNGDDVFAKDALVCYICHKQGQYGQPSGTPGFISEHNGVNSSGVHCNGDVYNTAGLVGPARLMPDEGLGMTDEEFQHEVAEGKYQATGGGSTLGIKCLLCHNASDKKTFGGIHGNAGNASYTTYSGAKVVSGVVTTVSRKPYRFMPGLGNFRYNGGDSAEQWTMKSVSQANKQGCYTLNGTSATRGGVGNQPTQAAGAGANTGGYNAATGVMGANGAPGNDNGILGSWGACTDHAGTSVFGGRAATRNVLRPLTY